MAKRDASFVDKHIEKVVLGVCALALLGAGWYSFMGERFVVDGVRPNGLFETISREAQQTASAVRNARPKENQSKRVDPEKDPVAQLERWFGAKAEGLIRIAGLESPVARTQPFPPEFISTTQTRPEDRRELAEIVSPGIPIVTSGRSGFDLPDEKPNLADYDGQDKGSGKVQVRNWVAVAAQVNLYQQEVNFLSKQYPPGSFLAVIRVVLQRKDDLAPWRGWQDVETYLPFKPIKRPRIMTPQGLRLEGLSAFRKLIESKQEYIARPKLPAKKSGDRITYPAVPYFPDPPSKDTDKRGLVRKWLKGAEKAMKGHTPFRSVDLDAAFVLLRAVVATSDARPKDIAKGQGLLKTVISRLKKDRPSVEDMDIRPPERLMPIVAYDLDAEPGHRYVYRMRYEVYNVFAGNPGDLKNPADAKKLALFSDWSPVSRPVTIESDVYLYLTDKNPKKREVTVTVYKKGRRGFSKQDFKVQVGDEIGHKVGLGRNKGVDFRTSAICVDIDFNRRVRGKPDVVMAYVDPGDGRLRERFLSQDKNDQFRQRLINRKTARR